MRTLYHISTEGKNVIFRSEHDFIYFMNKLGIVSDKLGVRIFAFCVMSTHLHTIVQTENIESFISTLNSLYIRHFAATYNIHGSNMVFTSNALKDQDYITSAIEYVLRNPVHHNVAANAFEYPYSSIRLPYPEIFNPPKRYWDEGICIEKNIKHTHELSMREIKSVFGRFTPNNDWLIKDSKLILPECYVDNSLIKEIYRTFRAYLYGMTQNRASSKSESSLAAYRISDIKVCRIIDNTLIQRGFRLDNMPLDVEEELRHCLYDYGATDAQIDRCLWKL